MYQKVDTNLNFVDREKKVEEFWKENHIFEKNKCNQRRSARNSAGNMQTGNRWHSYES